LACFRVYALKLKRFSRQKLAAMPRIDKHFLTGGGKETWREIQNPKEKEKKFSNGIETMFLH